MVTHGVSKGTARVEDTHIRWLYYITHITAQNVFPTYCTVTVPVVVVCVLLPVSRPPLQ